MIFSATSRARVRDAERLWIAKFIFRITTLVVVLIAIGCTAWALDRSAALGSEYHQFLLPWQFITLGISVLWNIANIIVRLSRPRPMHPGANVGMDLVLWLGLIVTGVFAIFPGLDNLSRSESLSYYSYQSSRRGRLQRALNHLGVVEVVGCAFTFLAVLLHFTLFVWACVDVNRRNKEIVDRRAAVIAQTMVTEMAQQGVLSSNQRFQPQQHAAPLLAPQGIHLKDSSTYDFSSRESMPLRHPTDGGGSMGKPSYMPVSTDEVDSSFPAPPMKHPRRGTASEDSIRGFQRGGIV